MRDTTVLSYIEQGFLKQQGEPFTIRAEKNFHLLFSRKKREKLFLGRPQEDHG
jgi:hypothetical protein